MSDVVKVTHKGNDLTTELLVASELKYLAWGTGAEEAAAVGDTELEGEVDDRVAATQSQQTDVQTNNVYRLVGELTAGDDRVIKELGVFDVITGASGNMYSRLTFGDITLGDGDKVEFTVDYKYADGS